MQDESEMQITPQTPTYKLVNDVKGAIIKLKQYLRGAKLDDLSIDFLGTQYFSDLYMMDSILGAGSFGVVIKSIEHDTGNEYAMKVCHLNYHRCFPRRI